MEYYKNSIKQYTTYYHGNYEREVDNISGKETKTYYIKAPAGLAAIYQTDDYTAKMYSVQTDHLGSITALKCGNFKEYYSYDAWGRRKNPVTHTYHNVAANTITRRGYTGHEHLDNIDIINMSYNFV